MWLKYPFILFFLCIMAIAQYSFLPRFGVAASAVNLVFIAFFIIIFFEKRRSWLFGLWVALVAGILLDLLFMPNFGWYMATLPVIYAACKIAVYFLKEGRRRWLIAYFAGLFGVFLIIFEVISRLAAREIPFDVFRGPVPGYGLAANLLIACLAFLLYKKAEDFAMRGTQLSLFD